MRTSLHSSTNTKNKSKRDIIGAERETFCCRDFARSYRPPIGFAAAKIDVLAFNVARTPAYNANSNKYIENPLTIHGKFDLRLLLSN